MFTREAGSCVPTSEIKSVSRAFVFSDKRTESTREDARLRKDRFLTKALSSHGKMFVRNLGSALEKHLSETIEEDLRKVGVGSLRDVYAGWEVGSENYGSVLMLTAMTLFSSGSSTLHVSHVHQTHRAQEG